jgi:hypothetical protein
VWWLVGAEGRYPGVQGFGIGTLENGHDPVVALALVELLRQRLDDLIVGARHSMPPLDFGLRKGAGGGSGEERETDDGRSNGSHTVHSLFDQALPASRVR